MYKFNGFTEKANAAVNAAIDFAQAMGHNYVGSEHILMGLLSDSDSAAYRILENAGADNDAITETIVHTIGAHSPTHLTPEDFTPRTKQLLQNAVRQAAKMGNSYVGTEHILLALIKTEGSSAIAVLSKLKCNIKKIYISI